MKRYLKAIILMTWFVILLISVHIFIDGTREHEELVALSKVVGNGERVLVMNVTVNGQCYQQIRHFLPAKFTGRYSFSNSSVSYFPGCTNQ